MMYLRRADDRGHADHGWLNSRHSFSFADYVDPAHMGFGNLRVINEDHIAPATGFGMHGHRDMEIVSYVLSGALRHQDSMGNIATIVPGEIQRMTAGTGVRHSEHNHAAGEKTHFLQIWLLPSAQSLAPSYEQRTVDRPAMRGHLSAIASADGRGGSMRLNADATLYAGLFDTNEAAQLTLSAERLTYVFLVRGALRANGQELVAGDALAMDGEPHLLLDNGRAAEVLVFDLARI